MEQGKRIVNVDARAGKEVQQRKGCNRKRLNSLRKRSSEDNESNYDGLEMHTGDSMEQFISVSSANDFGCESDVKDPFASSTNLSNLKKLIGSGSIMLSEESLLGSSANFEESNFSLLGSSANFEESNFSLLGSSGSLSDIDPPVCDKYAETAPTNTLAPTKAFPHSSKSFSRSSKGFPRASKSFTNTKCMPKNAGMKNSLRTQSGFFDDIPSEEPQNENEEKKDGEDTLKFQKRYIRDEYNQRHKGERGEDVYGSDLFKDVEEELLYALGNKVKVLSHNADVGTIKKVFADKFEYLVRFDNPRKGQPETLQVKQAQLEPGFVIFARNMTGTQTPNYEPINPANDPNHLPLFQEQQYVCTR